MNNFAGSKTESNLRVSISDKMESKNRYVFYAQLINSMGYDKIADAILEASYNETESEKIVYQTIQGPKKAAIDVFSILQECVEKERTNWQAKYNQMGDVAKEEGFGDVAELFYSFANLARKQEAMFRELIMSSISNPVYGIRQTMDFLNNKEQEAVSL